ncbi:MAG: hypothetical protein Q7S06_00170 [Nanoarchaeota archaeon]|nr:hypothetical protein [Nanoarchaeota archaeon]
MENPLRNLEIKNYYTYLLVIAGFILIFSLFFDSRIIDQSKLVVLCLITIVYGLIEWIRDKQIRSKLLQINGEWDNFWEMKNEKLPYPKNSEIIKEFKEKYKPEKLISKYHKITWIFLIVYLSLMVFVFYLI